MKKNVITFGLISGLIVSTFMAVSISVFHNCGNFDSGEIIGYSSMIVALAFVFVGIKNYRDKYSNGIITFGKAFKTGLLISLISSTLYVITWLIMYYVFMPDFMDKYSEYVINGLKEKGTAQAEIDKQLSQMASYKEMYKNPVFVILLTYAEILPVGIIISLISALILKRKQRTQESQHETV